MRAQEQEKAGSVFKLRGQAEVHYRTYILYADEITYDSQTGEATADGHAVLDGGPNDEHIEATHAIYNVRAETGTFDHVVGTIGMKVSGKRLILTSSNPFAFTGKKVVKTGPDHYVVYDGTVTSCELPHPKWEFKAHKVVVDVSGNATIYRSTFRLKGLPIVYFPFATHPVERLRQSGFLIPTIGRSSLKGTIVGESAYWAINPSMDARVGAEYFSSRGWSQQGEFRAAPSEKSFVDLNYFGVLDRGIEQSQTDPATGKVVPVHVDQGGEDVRLDAQSDFGHHFRGVANIDYLSSFVFRLAFNEIFSQAVHSEVQSQVFLSNTTRGFSFNGSAQRYQDFESTTPGDVITIVHAPSFESASVDRQIGNSPFYWSYDAAVGGLSRKDCEQLNDTATGCQQVFSTPLVGRFDFNPTLSMPLLLHGWSLRPEVSLRDTYYTRELFPSSGTGVSVNDPVNRKSVEGSVELRPPALDRVFDREFLGRKWKHVIEPRVTYRYLTGVDNFSHILRFDARDILSDTNEVEYALVNRLYAKRTSQQAEDCGPAGMPSLIIGRPVQQSPVPWERQTTPQAAPCKTGPQVREVVTWELAQKYFLDPNFGGALVPDRRNVFTTTADLSGVAFLTGPRNLSPLISRLRIQATSRIDAEWDLDYDFNGCSHVNGSGTCDVRQGLINSSTVLMNYRIGQFTFGAGDAYLRTQGELPSNVTPATPFVTPRFNQFRLLLGYGHPNKRGFSGAANIGFDANRGFLQYAAVQTAYNWDCCGVSLEYRRFALGSVRNENQFRFTFALSNIGAFGNLKREQKLF